MASSSSFSPFGVKLYYGGDVTYNDGVVTTDEHTKITIFFIRSQLSHSDFVDLICSHVEIEPRYCTLWLTLYFEFGECSHKLLIRGQNEMDTIYYLASSVPNYMAQVHVKWSQLSQHGSCLDLLHSFGMSHTTTYQQGEFNNQFGACETTHTGLDEIQTQGYQYHNDDNEDNVLIDYEGNVIEETEESEQSPSDYDTEQDDQIPDLPNQYGQEFQSGFPVKDTEGSGIDEDYVAHDHSDEPEMRFWSREDNEISLGMYFKTKKQVDNAVRLWNVARNREIFITDSRPEAFTTVCRSTRLPDVPPPPCGWTVSIRQSKNSPFFKVKKWTPEHSCFTTMTRNNNRSLRSNIVAAHINAQIVNDVSFPVKNIQALIKDNLHVDITYGKAWAARRKAIGNIYGNWGDNFDALPRYLLALQASNPGTVVQWRHHEYEPDGYKVFKYLFWAFRPSIEAFKYCIPVISIDGTHLKGEYKGKLLIAVTKNANNMILPLAYAVVDEETSESWKWFLQQFQDNVQDPGLRKLCVISDRHKGIQHAMDNLPAWKKHGAHRYCLRHVKSNFMSKVRNVTLRKLCWKIGSTTQERTYERCMNELKKANKVGWDYLAKISKSKWTLLHDKENRRWGNLTTNISESMNNVLKVARLLPIKALVEYTFKRDVEQFAKNWRNAFNCSTDFPEYMWQLFKKREELARQHNVYVYDEQEQRYMVQTKFQTDESGADDYTVEFREQTCSCGKWQAHRFPCSHVIAVCNWLRADPKTIVDRRFHADMYRAQYISHYYPLPNEEEWEDAGWFLAGDRAMLTVTRGRRRERRFNNEMDSTYAEQTLRKCSRCKQPGHMVNRCPNGQH